MLNNSKKLEDILNTDKTEILIKSKGGRYSSLFYEINLKNSIIYTEIPITKNFN